jgi:hypothetical protein
MCCCTKALGVGLHSGHDSTNNAGGSRVIRIVATHAYVWVRPILIEAGRELMESADGLLAGWADRCVFSSYFSEPEKNIHLRSFGVG